MGRKETVPNRRYTEEFKTEAVSLAMSTGGNAAAKRLGIPLSTMTNWVRQSREGASTPQLHHRRHRNLMSRIRNGPYGT